MRPLLISFLSIIYFYSFAQVPNAFNYQGQVRDDTGDPIINQSVSIKISILDGSVSGNIDYSETHNVLTDDNGIFSLEVGNGSSESGLFSAIDWGGGSKFLNIEMDTGGGNNFVNLGTSQFLSVPYALQSQNVINDRYIDNDADSTNEIQTISKVDSLIILTKGCLWRPITIFSGTRLPSLSVMSPDSRIFTKASKSFSLSSPDLRIIF